MIVLYYHVVVDVGVVIVVVIICITGAHAEAVWIVIVVTDIVLRRWCGCNICYQRLCRRFGGDVV